jgi:hypothetical protein
MFDLIAQTSMRAVCNEQRKGALQLATQLDKLAAAVERQQDVGKYRLAVVLPMQIAALAVFTAPSISCQTNSLSTLPGKKVLDRLRLARGQNRQAAVLCKRAARRLISERQESEYSNQYANTESPIHQRRQELRLFCDTLTGEK